jgi:haloalkane dehalogenase
MNDTDWIDRKEYPFVSRYFQTPAGKLHYVDEGDGQPIVMLHGNPTWSFLYRNLIKQLSPRYRCIAPDHIGFGLSDKPADWAYLPEEHAKNLSALIEHLGLKNVTLVVQDWGGPIGMHYAVTHPENVTRLIVMNTWAWPVNRDFHYISFSAFMGGPIGRLLIRKRNFFARTFMRAAFGDKSKLSTAAHQHYLRALPTAADRKGCYVFPKQIVDSTPWLEQIWNKVAALRDKPTLFVWGMKDVAFREKELQRWQNALPNSQTVRLATVGHFVQEEAPEELAKAVAAFLDRKD